MSDTPRPPSPETPPEAPNPSPPERRFWLADLSVRQPVFITMLVVAVLVVGVIAYTRLGLELFPDVSLPIVVVQTTYPGVGPDEVERSVSKVIEDVVSPLGGVESIRSTSTDSVSVVIVEFSMKKDGKEAADEVSSAVNTIRNQLPADVQEPVIARFDFNSAPVLSIAVSDQNGGRSLEDLRRLADDTLKARLERLPGVASVDVVGGVNREVHVDLDLPQLEAHHIAPQQVLQAIRSENVNLPIGRVPDGAHDELLQATGEARTLADLGDLPVLTRKDNPPVRLRNVAAISVGPAEAKTLSRLDGRESLVLNVRKQSRGNTVSVADGVKGELDQLRADYPTLSFALAYDGSTFTRQSVEDVQVSLALGALLAAIVVLLFFRDLRGTLVTVAGLPVVLAGTAAVMQMLGMTLNMITLMALSLSIGMLIDDAIVVRENIFRHVERGEPPREAAVRGTGEIALAVFAVSSTIVAVFLPIAFTEGIAGQFLRDFGITVAVAVVISLLESFTLAPMLSAVFFRTSRRNATTTESLAGVRRGYRSLLGWALRHRLVVVLASALTLVGIAYVLPKMVFAFSPSSDQGEFGVTVTLDAGSRLADTDQASRAVEQVLSGEPEVANVFATVGSSSGATESATVLVKLKERGKTAALVERIRPDLERALPTGKLAIDLQSNSAASGSSEAIGAVRGRPIQFSVQGDNMADLDTASGLLVDRLRGIPGLVDVDRSLKAAIQGQSIEVDRQKAADQGVTASQIGSTVRSLVNGERAGQLRSDTEDLDIVVQLAEAYRDNLSDILALPIITPKGDQVDLSTLASLVSRDEPSQIDRYDRQRQVIVGAGYLGRSQGAVLADARAAAAALAVPPGVTIQVSGSAKSQDEMFASLGMALGLSVLFIYMILASQFGSFSHPFTIMLALPFSAVGALAALYFGGFPFDMLGMIGIILLMGLVTKNSILLVEFTNQLRRRGVPTREALLQAGPVRLRPILMTTLSMIFGMLPVAAGLGAGSEMRQPMGVAIIGGLMTSTLLTLVVVPVAYSLVDDLGVALGRGRTEPSVRRRRLGPLGLALRWSVGVAAVALLGYGAATYAPSGRESATDSTPEAAAIPTPRPAVTASPISGVVSIEPVSVVPTPGPPSFPMPAQVPSGAVPGQRPTATAPAGPATPTAPAGSGSVVASTGGMGVNVRSAPGTDAGRIAAFPEGTRLTPLGQEQRDAAGRAWVKVSGPGGAVGWVAKDYVH